MKHMTRTEDEKKALAVDVIAYLNELVAADPEAMHTLVESRVVVNEDLTNHPTAQVIPTPSGHYELGLLGVVNGIVGIREDGWGYIVGCFDDDTGRLLSFDLTEKFAKKVDP